MSGSDFPLPPRSKPGDYNLHPGFSDYYVPVHKSDGNTITSEKLPISIPPTSRSSCVVMSAGMESPPDVSPITGVLRSGMAPGRSWPFSPASSSSANAQEAALQKAQGSKSRRGGARDMERLDTRAESNLKRFGVARARS